MLRHLKRAEKIELRGRSPDRSAASGYLLGSPMPPSSTIEGTVTYLGIPAGTTTCYSPRWALPANAGRVVRKFRAVSLQKDRDVGTPAPRVITTEPAEVAREANEMVVSFSNQQRDNRSAA